MEKEKVGEEREGVKGGRGWRAKVWLRIEGDNDAFRKVAKKV